MLSFEKQQEIADKLKSLNGQLKDELQVYESLYNKRRKSQKDKDELLATYFKMLYLKHQYSEIIDELKKLQNQIGK